MIVQIIFPINIEEWNKPIPERWIEKEIYINPDMIHKQEQNIYWGKRRGSRFYILNDDEKGIYLTWHFVIAILEP